MDYFRTQYEKYYEGDEYYWGLEPAPFLGELLKTHSGNPSELKILDICQNRDAIIVWTQ